MITTAGFFKAACDAGLTLIGEEDKQPVFSGSELKLSLFRYYLAARNIESNIRIEIL